MTFMRDENLIKLDILKSLARSQKAISRIMEYTGDCICVGSREISPEAFRNYLQKICKYQQILLYRISGLKISHRKRGNPASPWLNGQVCRSLAHSKR